MGEDRAMCAEKAGDPLLLPHNRQRKSSVVSTCSEDTESVSSSTTPMADDEMGEELEYGPGIVSKLKTRFLSMSLMQNRGAAMRRSCSMENLLDQERPCRTFEQKAVPDSGRDEPWGSLKRAKSMDTLLADLQKPEAPRKDPPRVSLHLRGQQAICDEELPKPDTVKTYKRMFEPAEARRGSCSRRPPVLRASAKSGVAAKVSSSAKTNGTVSKSKLCAKQSPVPNGVKSPVKEIIDTLCNEDAPRVAPTKLVKNGTQKESKAVCNGIEPASQKCEASTVKEIIHQTNRKSSVGVKPKVPPNRPAFVKNPKHSFAKTVPTVVGLKAGSAVQKPESVRHLETKVEKKQNGCLRAEAEPLSPESSEDRVSLKDGISPKALFSKNGTSPKALMSPKAGIPSKDGISPKTLVSSRDTSKAFPKSSVSPKDGAPCTDETSCKDKTSFKKETSCTDGPSFKNEISYKDETSFKNEMSCKNGTSLKNETPCKNGASFKGETFSKDGTTSFKYETSPKTGIPVVNGTSPKVGASPKEDFKKIGDTSTKAVVEGNTNHCNSVKSDGVTVTPPSKKSSASTSMVFDFRGKDVIAHVARLPPPFGCKRRSLLIDGLKGGMGVAQGVDEGEEEEYQVDYSVPLPCGLVFEGENVKVGKGSILSTRNKDLKITFDDNVDDNTFVYPSESSFTEEEPPPPPSSEALTNGHSTSLKANTSIGSCGSGSLSSYTPRLLRTVDGFEPGMFRQQTTHQDPGTSDEPRVEEEEEEGEMLKPAEISSSWSLAAGISDLLF